MTIQPLGNRIFVETVEEVLSSGIAIPETYQRDSRIGIVRAVGNGRRGKNGERIPITSVKIGDKVLLPQALGPGSRDILIDGKQCHSIILEELLGVMEPELKTEHDPGRSLCGTRWADVDEGGG